MRRAIAATCALAAAALAGCSVLEPARDAIPEAPGDAAPGGRITIGITDPGPIDPLHVATRSGRMVAGALCDTMVAIDPETHQAKPAIARKFVTATEGSTITLLPLHDAAFPGGKTLSSKDLNAGMKAMLEPVNSSPGASLAAFFAGGVLASDSEDGGGQKQPLLVEEARDSMNPAQPLNDYDVQLQSVPAQSNGVRAFAEISTAPFDPQAYEKDPLGFTRNPVCIGPYVLDGPYEPGDTEINLVRNADYYAQNTGYTRGGAGYADELTFKIYRSEDAAYKAFTSGDVDVAALPLSQMQDPRVGDDELVIADPTTVSYIGYATREEYQNTPAYRKAWSQAIDRAELVKNVFGVRGTLADGFFPPALNRTAGPSNSQEGAPLSMPTCELPVHDVEAAKKTLQPYFESNPIGSLELIGLQGGDSGRRSENLMTSVVNTWAKDLDLPFPRPYGVPEDELGDSLGGACGASAAFEMTWSTTALNPTAMFNDPQPYAEALFTRDGLEAGTNASAFASGPVEYQITERLGRYEDPVIRQQALDELGNVLCDELPMLPIAYLSDVWVMNPDLKSARDTKTGYDGLPLLRELYRN